MLFRPLAAIGGRGPNGAFTSTNLLPATGARGVLGAVFAVGAACCGHGERARPGGPLPPDPTFTHPLAHIPVSRSPEPLPRAAPPSSASPRRTARILPLM